MKTVLENIAVDFDYVDGSGSWKEHTVSPEGYFDSNYLLVGADVIESPPLHQNLFRYIPTEVNIRVVRVHLSDRASGRSRQVKAEYWNERQSSLQAMTDFNANGEISFRNRVITQQILLGEVRGWIITRFEGDGQSLKAVSTAFVRENDDGTQTDHPFDVLKKIF